MADSEQQLLKQRVAEAALTRVQADSILGIGSGSTIEGAIIDKNARIGKNVVIRARTDLNEMVDEEHYVIRDGLVIVPKGAIIPDGTVI